MNNDIKKHCPNCGAPLTTEICPYCKNKTGLNTKDADMEYPVIECKEAIINFWNVAFPMIFAVSFGFFGFIFPLIFILTMPEEGLIVLLGCSIFAIIGIVAFAIAMISITRYLSVKKKGKEIEATVYGYLHDNLMINGEYAQVVKLLVNTKEGPRFILYQLGNTTKPYKINGKIKLLVYKDRFMIKKEDKNYF